MVHNTLLLANKCKCFTEMFSWLCLTLVAAPTSQTKKRLFYVLDSNYPCGLAHNQCEVLERFGVLWFCVSACVFLWTLKVFGVWGLWLCLEYAKVQKYD